MSLITLKLQEASVFIIISAKVSVMNLECSWETSVRNRARDEDERHHLFLFFFHLLSKSGYDLRCQMESERLRVLHGHCHPTNIMEKLCNK